MWKILLADGGTAGKINGCERESRLQPHTALNIAAVNIVRTNDSHTTK